MTRLLAGAEAAFRDALTRSVTDLAVGDRNLLRFHYFHGLPVERLADMFCVPRTAMARQLVRIRARSPDRRRAQPVRRRDDARALS